MVSVTPDISTLIQMANFLVLLIALNYLLYKPIRGIIRQRSEKVAQLNSDITSNQEGARAKEGELESRRVQARKHGGEMKEEMKAEGHSREREIIEAATAEMEKAVAKVREEVAKDIGQAREDLKGQVQAFGLELAQKILGRSIQ